MITIPMRVQTEGIVVPMHISTDIENVGMSIGASYSVVAGELYDGPYEVTPKAWEAQTLATKDKLMEEDVTVFKIPYYETSNIFDGLTVFIAEDING
jgi:hypothetical protein